MIFLDSSKQEETILLPPKIILIDGDCHLCYKSVQLIIKNDPKALFKFASLQSPIGLNLCKKFNIPVDDTINTPSTIVLIENSKASSSQSITGKVFIKSDAIFQIARYMSWPWKGTVIFLVLPKFIRDMIYDLVAKNRYRLFGKNEVCLINKGGSKATDVNPRFLDV